MQENAMEHSAMTRDANVASSAPTSAAAAANAFLELGWAEPQYPPIDPMKLQKLLFYAHAWYLAMKGKPLFDEDFEAWPWGPVVRNVYLETREFGREPVRERVSEIRRVDDSSLEFKRMAPEITDPETLQFIKAVWDTHKPLTGIELSNATHLDGEPWTIVKEQYGSLDDKPTIPNDLIRAVFEKKLADDATADSTAA